MAKGGSGFRGWIENAVARTLLGVALALPYRWRVPLIGKIVAYGVAPVAGYSKRVHANLRHTMPELDQAERRRIARAVADNFGRTLIEIYSGEDFVDRARAAPLEGSGVAALEAARAAGRPVILITAHLGNYDAARGKLAREGYEMAALYRPMRNASFNQHYVNAISTIAAPVFPTNARGITSLIKHLKDGGVIGIVADVASLKAPILSFFDQPAHTPLSAAEWAIKYDAALIPIFGIRQPDGLSFRVLLEDPLAHSTPDAMMQAYNDVVERVARAHPEQWFWIHRRWKQRAEVSADAPPPE